MVVLTKRIDDLTKGKSEKGKNKKGKSDKGLIAESFGWDKESVSSVDEGTTKIKAFMTIAKDEPYVGKADSRSSQWVEIKMKKVHRLLSMTEGAELADTSNCLISLADLTLNMADLTLNTSISKKTKPTSDKVSHTHAIKKKTETKSSTVPTLIFEKKSEASTENLLLTLIKEVKSLKEHIKVPSDNSTPVSQTRSSKSSKADDSLQPPFPQDRWSREKHIKLVNIIGEPLDGITTRKRIRDSEVASAHECLYVNFLSEMEPKKLIEALKQESLHGFYGVSDGCKKCIFEWENLRGDVCSTTSCGFQIKQDFKGISIFQEKYVKDLLKKYDLADNALVKCPMLSTNNLGPNESGVFVNETLFRGMIGSLMYLIASRPDIQFSTCLCARYQGNPEESHLVAVKRIFRYLKGTPNIGLWYPKGSGFNLKTSSNSYYVGCNLDKKSTSGMSNALWKVSMLECKEAKLCGNVIS
nr:uncharacterized mitochondrial protein AtMg00810-like [Tanacetum cinerariifolium]